MSNLDRSLAFWEWLLVELGYERYQAWDHGCSFRLGETYLVFVQAEAAFVAQSFHRKRPGLNHLAFWAPSSEWVTTLPNRLRDRGVRVLYAERSPAEEGAPSASTVFFEDPDRIKVEVVAPASRNA